MRGAAGTRPRTSLPVAASQSEPGERLAPPSPPPHTHTRTQARRARARSRAYACAAPLGPAPWLRFLSRRANQKPQRDSRLHPPHKKPKGQDETSSRTLARMRGALFFFFPFPFPAAESQSEAGERHAPARKTRPLRRGGDSAPRRLRRRRRRPAEDVVEGLPPSRRVLSVFLIFWVFGGLSVAQLSV